jgi:general secretion pathway protein J
MNERGFTLVELLVALTIFALLAGAGVALLSVSVRSQELVKSQIDQTAATGRISSVLGQDFAQIVPRVWRNLDGAEQAAFSGNGGGGVGDVVSFVRVAPQGGVQRIVLRRLGKRLDRLTFDHPDSETASRQSILAEDVTKLQMRYRQRGAWNDTWQPTRADSLPEAVEIVIGRTGQPEVRYAFIAGARVR